MKHGISAEHIYTHAQLNTTIEELDLSVRAYNCIKRDGINTVAELLNNLHRLDKVRNLGNKCRKQIYEKLQEMSGNKIEDNSDVMSLEKAIEVMRKTFAHGLLLDDEYKAIEVLIKHAEGVRKSK